MTPTQMLLNDGTGNFTFRNSCVYPTRSANFDLVAGDFENNDSLDIVIPNVGTAFPNPNAVRIMKGTPSVPCLFQFTGFVFPTGTQVPEAITAGDFDGDGLLDVAVVGYQSNTVGVLLNTGPTIPSPVNFGAPINFAAGLAPRDIVTGDFNGDGKLDLAVAASGEDSVKIFLGVGNGTFTPTFSVAVGDSPVAIVADHFDADGNLDLAVANYKSNNVTVLLGQGDGQFTQAPGSPVAVGTGPTAITAADIYGHSSRDLVVANRLSSTLTVLFDGNGNYTLRSSCSFPLPPGPTSVITADFDGDGKPDIAASSDNFDFSGADTVTVFLNQTTPVSVDGLPASRQFVLAQNAPNPFSASTALRFELPQSGHVRGEIYDLGGRRVRTFVDGDLSAGPHVFAWDGRNEDGRALPAGVYLYRVRWQGVAVTQRAVLMR